MERARARIVYDSRGSPTIEVEVRTASGAVGTAAAPAGKSRGRHEAVPYPDGDPYRSAQIFNQEIALKLVGRDALDQRGVDAFLREVDGTPNFSRIGGNLALATSVAIAWAAARSASLPLFAHLSKIFNMRTALPLPLGNVIGGGAHTLGQAPDIQEFLVFAFPEASLRKAVEANFLVHRRVSSALTELFPKAAIGRNDEGAWAAPLPSEQALSLLTDIIESVANETGVPLAVGLDVAASSLWDSSRQQYVYKREGVRRDPGEQIDFIIDLVSTYPIKYVEDPLHEDDFAGFREITDKLRKFDCLVCGDDLFVTNPERLEHGIKEGAASAILVKPNQVGTLSDTFRVAQLAHTHGYVRIASHRSGETEYAYLSHVAVAIGARLIKTGIMGSERVAKLNELIRIAEHLGIER
ncbi:phosphopyruvate hydratase [archaeon]|nr:phosphopyruvate hydratase [archaeon]